MKNPYSNIRNAKLPSKNDIKLAIAHFSKLEWKIFFGLLIVLLISTVAILGNVNQSFMVEVPRSGGSISEGIIGTPRFVNPILGTSDTDKDVVALIYSGLMRRDTDGNLIPDLAEKYEVSSGGLVYTFTLKDDIYFHNDEPVTVDDIIFTINTIKDPLVKSPKKSSWDGISVEKVDEKTIRFNLKQPYISFLENTTLGIMPKNIWSGSPIELNTANIEPVGSGPYMVDNVNKESSGAVTSYDLKYFKKFTLGKPYIKNITLKFYSNEEDSINALKGGSVEQLSSISPENAEILKEKGYNIDFAVLPRVFGLFFNQNQNQIFTNKNVSKAITLAINKDRIVEEVLKGYGSPIVGPIPQNIINYDKLSGANNTNHEANLEKAKAILTKDGWKENAEGFLEKTTTEKKVKTTTLLAFSISTGNAPDLKATAEIIKQDLEAIGIKVEVKTFESGNLNQGVIRPRKYDALLFGQIINSESDLFAFWHSSQRVDPGLNIAMYTNSKVDKILEDAYITIDRENRIKKYAQFEDEINKDSPAVFLYSPSLIYVKKKGIENINITHITSPSQRWSNVYKWYINTDNVWKIFTK